MKSLTVIDVSRGQVSVSSFICKRIEAICSKNDQVRAIFVSRGDFIEISNLSKLQFSPVLVVILKIVLEAQFWG